MSEEKVSGSRLLKAVETIAISPAEAKKIVNNYVRQSHRKHPNDSEWQHQERVADKIIARYCKLAALVGGTSSLTSIIPGLGTAISMTGGAFVDATVCMKLQVDMSMCLAETFGYDLNSEDARHLSLLIAASGTLEKAGKDTLVKLASEAGVRMLRQYLKGAALTAVKEAFKKIGITFTRKALEKALPFGVGVAVGSGANYALTWFVGNQAKQWFIIDRSMPKEESETLPDSDESKPPPDSEPEQRGDFSSSQEPQPAKVIIAKRVSPDEYEA